MLIEIDIFHFILTTFVFFSVWLRIGCTNTYCSPHLAGRLLSFIFAGSRLFNHFYYLVLIASYYYHAGWLLNWKKNCKTIQRLLKPLPSAMKAEDYWQLKFGNHSSSSSSSFYHPRLIYTRTAFVVSHELLIVVHIAPGWLLYWKNEKPFNACWRPYPRQKFSWQLLILYLNKN